MAESSRQRSPTQELIVRLFKVARASPEAASEILELMFLASQIEALTTVDRDYRDARRVISRLRNPLWDLNAADRQTLLSAAEAIRKACGLTESDLPAVPIADLGERERIERHIMASLGDELDAWQIARVAGAVSAALQR